MGLPCGHRSRSATSTPPRPPRSLAPAMRNASGCASTTRSGPSPRDRGRSSTTGRSCSAAAGSNRMPTSHFWVYNSGQEALHVRHVGCPGLSAGDGHPHLPVVSLPLAILVLAYAVGPGSDYPGVYPDTLLIAEAGVRSALRFHIHRIDDLGRGRADAVPHAPRARPETRITTLARATARGGQFPPVPTAPELGGPTGLPAATTPIRNIGVTVRNKMPRTMGRTPWFATDAHARSRSMDDADFVGDKRVQGGSARTRGFTPQFVQNRRRARGRLPAEEAVRGVPLFRHVQVEPVRPALLARTGRVREARHERRPARRPHVRQQARREACHPPEGALDVHLLAGVVELPRRQL